jgi:ribosomal protein S18 acetylase RimI-like enzyme
MEDDYDAVVASRDVTVAELEGEIVGLIVLGRDGEDLVIENVAVHPGQQGTGVGRTLLEHAESSARGAGLGSIRLFTHELMEENLALYQRAGYVEFDRRRHGDATLVHMRKRLDQAGPGPSGPDG